MLSRAEADFERQFEYLLKRSPQGANAWADAVDEAIGELRHSADSYGLSPESVDHPFDVHQVTFKTKSGNQYRMLYEINETAVFILTIRGVGQDVVDLD